MCNGMCVRCGRKLALPNEQMFHGMCSECWDEKCREDEIAEARQDVLEFMDRQLRILGVEEDILDEVWSSTCAKFRLGDAV